MSIASELRSRLRNLQPEIRAAYEATLAKLSDLGIHTESDLVAALESRSEGRLLACWAAGELRAHATSTLLWTIIETDADTAIEAAKALLKLYVGDEMVSMVPRCAALLEARAAASAIRIAAAYALAQTNELAIGSLTETLADLHDDPAVRAHCAEALGVLHAGTAVPLLIGTLQDMHPEVRYWSAYALGEIGDVRAADALLRLAEHDATTIERPVSEEARRAFDAIMNRNRY